MSAWFFDETKEGGECQHLGRQTQAPEKEYLEIRKLVHEAEAAL
jgi:hypothetical protein